MPEVSGIVEHDKDPSDEDDIAYEDSTFAPLPNDDNAGNRNAEASLIEPRAASARIKVLERTDVQNLNSTLSSHSSASYTFSRRFTELT